MPEEAIMPQELVGYCERQVCSPMKSSSLHAHIFLDIQNLALQAGIERMLETLIECHHHILQSSFVLATSKNVVIL
jgi:hypothetical protein